MKPELKRYIISGEVQWSYEIPPGGRAVENLTPEEELKLMLVSEGELDWARDKAGAIYSAIDEPRARDREKYLTTLLPGLVRQLRYENSFNQPKKGK